MKISDKIKKLVNEKYYPRVDEMCNVLDDKVEYSVMHTKNRAEYSLALKNLKSDDNVLFMTNLILSGEIVMYPIVQVTGEFVAMLLIIDRQIYNRFEKQYKILVYEEDSDLRASLDWRS